MSKYGALGEYLKHQRGDHVPITFGEIEKITGVKLPASSRYRAWWSNNDFNSVLTKFGSKPALKASRSTCRRANLFSAVSAGRRRRRSGPIHRREAVSSRLRRNARSHSHHAGHRPHAASRSRMADRLDEQYGKEKREE